MLKLINNWWVKALFSGILTVIAVTQTSYILGWICFVPLFMVLQNIDSKTGFKSGLLFGAVISVIGFYWMIPGAERFTGSSVFYGIGVFLLSGIFFSAFWALLAYCINRFIVSLKKTNHIAIKAVAVASIFSVFEAILMFVSAGFPWFDFHAGYALANNLYFIQPASFFGVYVITFIIILVNYLIAACISEKRWTKLVIPAAIIAVYFLCGFFILKNFKDNLPAGKAVKVAILSENIAPEIKWNDTTGNQLVQRLLDLNRSAAASGPDIALWSESAVPWTYRPNDDLVHEVLKISAPANITNVMGINTEVAANVVYNSAYCILPDGNVGGRYDKQVLLSFIEKPLGGKLIPFFSSNGFYAQPGKYGDPLNTPYGKAGIMICNESAVPSAAYNPVRKGAQFIFNMSNDGWFNNTYIVNLHFCNARLRAVETRKDVVVNSNEGISGLIQASGRIVSAQRSTDPYVNNVTVHTNDIKTLAVDCPNLFIYVCCGLLILLTGVNRLTK